jgi:hypothetical protein
MYQESLKFVTTQRLNDGLLKHIKVRIFQPPAVKITVLFSPDSAHKARLNEVETERYNQLISIH